MGKKINKTVLFNELFSHLPFSIFFTAAGMVVAGILLYIGIVSGPVNVQGHPYQAEKISKTDGHHKPGETAYDHHHDAIRVNPLINVASGVMFHLFHPIHLMLSAIATTAMFWRHEKRLIKSIVIGFFGSVGVCGLSDIFLPFLSGKLLGVKNMHFHWCVIEHPQMVFPFIIIGIICGIIAADRIGQSTKFSHSSHIFVSVIASLFYLISYGVDNWVAENVFPFIFIIVILCVTIPCCFSDIIFPLLTTTCPQDSCCEDMHT